MSSSILGVGQSALAAAQAGLATTGHNIANVNTPGYSRQVVVQASAGSQNTGVGFIGKGSAVVDVRRVYNDLVAGQVRTSLSSQNQIQTYYSQISQINDQLGDPDAGLSPAIQDFFKGVQDLAANPNAVASRQAALSSGEALAARFQSLDARLGEVEEGVNAQILSSVGTINVYAQQIAKLNDAIEKSLGDAEGKAPNDLLDQRDQVLTELSKETRTTVVKQGNSYNVFIGNGQPLIVGGNTYGLVAQASATDPTRIGVAYESNGKTIALGENSLPGGKLGGLLEFRATSMDPARNALGRIAVGMATTFNAQHRLGQDQNGALGGDFFVAAAPVVEPSGMNNSATAPKIGAVISDASKLTTSDYRLQFTNGNYVVTRLADNAQLYSNSTFPNGGNVIEGVTLNLSSGSFSDGDEFVIRPTANGAASFAVSIQDVSKIAAGAPIRTAAPASNLGSGKISPGVVSSTALLSGSGGGQTLTYTAATGQLSGLPSNLPISVNGVLQPAGTTSVAYTGAESISINGIDLKGMPAPASPPGPATTSVTVSANATLTYTSATKVLSGFSPYLDVQVMHADGSSNTYAAGTAAIPYTSGDTFAAGGVSYTLTGTPADGDKFTISSNSGGVGDSRNAVLLGNLQAANTLANGTTSFQGAYAQVISTIGNKTRELEVTAKAETSYLEQAQAAQQSESGVNLDEEAANLIRYQQAYQAAAKVMQTASTLFDTLLNLGR